MPPGRELTTELLKLIGQSPDQDLRKPLLERIRNGEIDPSFVGRNRYEISPAR